MSRSVESIICRVCRNPATRNWRGETLLHTTAATGTGAAYTPAEVCSGSTPGARP